MIAWHEMTQEQRDLYKPSDLDLLRDEWCHTDRSKSFREYVRDKRPDLYREYMTPLPEDEVSI